MAIKDKIVLVTGSTDGIGKQTAIDLAEMGAHVIVHGRSEKRARDAMQDIKERTDNNNLHFVVADLSSFSQIRKTADTIYQQFDKIDVLINNAGVYKTHRELSENGYELTFAINYLAHFLLTNFLLDLIKKSISKRIVNVASQAHGSSLEFDNLQGEQYYDGYDAYSRSKLCNIMFTYSLALKLERTGISANVLHPGVISTKLLREGFGMEGASIESGSETSVYLASTDEVNNVSGKYFVNKTESNSSKISYNTQFQEQLWEASEKMTGLNFKV